MLISESYRELNQKLHESKPEYGTTGGNYAPLVIELAGRLKTRDILDYGCGKCTLEKALPFPIRNYDPAIPAFSASPEPADLVVCTDVLEHIEPEAIGEVLDDLKRVTKRAALIIIATRPALKTLEDGRNAHLIQEGESWWIPKLAERFEIQQCEDHGHSLSVIVSRKLERGVMAVKRNGKRFLFDVMNEFTEGRARSLFSKEPDTIEWIEGMHAGETLIDVGANVGPYTVFAGVLGIRVFAFEPESQNYALLNSNIALNEIDAVAYCAALSDRAEVDTLYLSSFTPGTSCHTFGENLNHRLEARTSPPHMQGCVSLKLDDLHIPADHIKIDVDGLEHKVFAGGELTIQLAKSALIEINSNLAEHRKLVEKMLWWGFTYDAHQVKAARRTSGAFTGVGNYVFRR